MTPEQYYIKTFIKCSENDKDGKRIYIPYKEEYYPIILNAYNNLETNASKLARLVQKEDLFVNDWETLEERLQQYNTLLQVIPEKLLKKYNLPIKRFRILINDYRLIAVDLAKEFTNAYNSIATIIQDSPNAVLSISIGDNHYNLSYLTEGEPTKSDDKNYYVILEIVNKLKTKCEDLLKDIDYTKSNDARCIYVAKKSINNTRDDVGLGDAETTSEVTIYISKDGIIDKNMTTQEINDLFSTPPFMEYMEGGKKVK